jgi:hypothetical protein
MRLRSFMIATAVAAVAAASLLLGSPAGAQEGEGIITLEATHPAGLSVHFIVRVTWENDGRPADDAIVTATAVATDGTRLTPVTLAPVDNDGRYADAIDFDAPGSWTVRFASTDPTGTAVITQTVDAATDDGASGDSGEGAFAPADDDTGSSAEASTSNGGDEGGMPIWLVGAAAIVVFGGGVLALRTVRRYRAEAADEEAQFERLGAARTAGKASDSPEGPAQGPKVDP